LLLNRNPFFHFRCILPLSDEPRTQAAQHTTALHRSNIERVAAAKRRRERLESFRKLQEQLLRPPKLSSSGSAAWGAGQSERKASEDSRRQHVLDVAADMSWVLAEEPAQRDRAQRAHTLAVAAAKARGKKVGHQRDSWIEVCLSPLFRRCGAPTNLDQRNLRTKLWNISIVEALRRSTSFKVLLRETT